MKRYFLAVLFAGLLVWSCEKKDDPVVTSISIPNEITMDIGSSKKVEVKHVPADLPAPAYEWQTSDAEIFTVDNKGNIQALKVGEATLAVKAPALNLSASAKIKVVPIHATGITLSHKDVVMEMTDQIKIQATLAPENATNKKVIWSSGDEKIAQVDQNGTVTGMMTGKTVITAKTEDGDFTAQCNVTVNLKGIKLSMNDIELAFPDAAEVIHVLYSTNNEAYLEAIWSSSNPSVATVTGDGKGTNSALIKAVAEGEAVITATSADGSKTATCTVKVVKVKVQQVSLNYSSVSLLPDETKQLSAIISPTNAYNKGLTWESSNSSVATVTQEGLLKAHQLGSATMTVKSDDGGASTTCSVLVQDITSFISLSFRGSGGVIINGFVTGDLYSEITNNSSQAIELTSLYIYDGYSGKLVGYSTDPSKLGNLTAGSSTNLGMKFNSVYYPIFKWKFKWNNQEYEVQHQYSSSLRSTSLKGKKLNLIDGIGK
ncbi:Ig-like domain-containing protein [Limibacterium fermenti]|uniref:Ig-like domain-containing protein n=1 Tax=Limibacterium fermenti TaxID=3229863 RepID=UPI003A6FA002